MRIFRFILFSIALALLSVSIDQFLKGYRDWEQAQLAEAGYRAEIESLETKRDKLKHRVEMLKIDELTRERLARERLGYIKPGEIKFKIAKPTGTE